MKLKINIFIFILTLLFLPSLAHATTYYVDCSYGSDSNTTFTSGYQTAATTGPLKTLQALSNSTTNILAGDIVAIRAGTTCRPVNGNNNWVFKPGNAGGTFGGTVSNPVTVTSYGEGLAPVIDGADCMGALSGNCANSALATGVAWSSCSTGCPAVSANIYKTAWANRPYAVFIDNDTGYPSLRAATCFNGTCLSTPHGSAVPIPAFKLPFWATATGYTTGDAVQNAGFWYTAGSTATSGATAPTCKTGTCSDGTIIWTPRGPSYATLLAMTNNTWFWDGTNLYIQTNANDNPANHVVESSDMAIGTVWINPASTELNGITFDHVTVRHGAYNIKVNAPAGYSGLTLRNISALQAGTLPIDDSEDLANILINANAVTPATKIAVYNSRIIYGTKSNITFQCTTGTIIQGNEIAWNNHGGVNNRDQVACPTTNTGDVIIGNTIHGLVMSQGTQTGTPGGIYIENPDPTTLISKNVFYDMDDFGVCAQNAANCAAISLYKGTGGYIVSNIMEGSNCALQLDSSPSNLRVYGNLANTDYGPNNEALAITTSALGTGNIFDNNDWYSQSNNPVIVLGTPESFSTWQASTGTPDQHGQSTDLVQLLPSERYWLLKRLESNTQDLNYR